MRPAHALLTLALLATTAAPLAAGTDATSTLVCVDQSQFPYVFYLDQCASPSVEVGIGPDGLPYVRVCGVAPTCVMVTVRDGIVHDLVGLP
jgi:hypothetical protein